MAFHAHKVRISRRARRGYITLAKQAYHARRSCSISLRASGQRRLNTRRATRISFTSWRLPKRKQTKRKLGLQFYGKAVSLTRLRSSPYETSAARSEECLALPLRLLSQNLPQKSNFGRNGEERMNENEKENSRLSRVPRVVLGLRPPRCGDPVLFRDGATHRLEKQRTAV